MSAPKTKIRHAIELIADYYEQHDELSRAAVARRASDDDLLDVIKGVLLDLSNTEKAYFNEKGNSKQRDEIARLKAELKTAKSPQADELERVNARLGRAQQELDEMRALRATATVDANTP